MELTIEKRDLLRGLSRTHAVADRKSSMPILSNVLMAAESDGRLRLAATDLYLGMTSIVPAKVMKAGSIAVAARTLYDIVRALPEGTITWRVGPNQAATLEQGTIRYKIPGLPGDDFPALPNPGDAKSTHVDAELVGNLIGLTSFSMSTDDTRPHLAGTLFQAEGPTVRMVTTDGHRLSKAEVTLPDTDPERAFRMLVPHKGVGELKRVAEEGTSEAVPSDLGIATAGGYAFFRRGDLLLSVKLADESFPEYDRVIPKELSKTVHASRDALVASLKRIALVASDKSGGVQLHIEPGLMRVQSQNPEVGEGTEELRVDYAGDPVVIGFNARYLLDVLGALGDDEVSLLLSGELDPGVIRPVTNDGSDFVGVIMPMRI